MKKAVFGVTVLLLLVSPVWAGTYHACNGITNVNDADKWGDTDNGVCACSGTTHTVGAGGFPANGDVLEANGCTIALNVNPGAGVSLNTAGDGGGFTISSGTITIASNIGLSASTGASDVLTISGGTVTLTGSIYGGGTANADGVVLTTGNPTVTFGASGSPITIVGGKASTTYGVNDLRNAGTGNVYANITSGTNAGGTGYSSSAAVSLAFVGNMTAVNANGVTLSGAAAHTVTGNCTGSNANNSVGVSAAGAGAVTVAGNIIAGTRGLGVGGNIIWNPTAPGAAGAGHYISMQAPASATIYVSKDPGKANVLSSAYICENDDGEMVAGTNKGGGTWGF